jgi:hypothetical protein
MLSIGGPTTEPYLSESLPDSQETTHLYEHILHQHLGGYLAHYDMNEEADASAALAPSPTLPRVGQVSCSAAVVYSQDDPTPWAPATPVLSGFAQSSGLVQAYYVPLMTATPPFLNPDGLNVLFSAYGNGQVLAGGGGYKFAARLWYPDVPVLYIINAGYAPLADSPPPIIYPFTIPWTLVTGGAIIPMTAYAFATASLPDGSTDFSALATAFVDPILELDQATFDAEYAPLAYNLSDYFQIGISPNATAVPEPSALLLLGSGLIGLVGLWRKLKK